MRLYDAPYIGCTTSLHGFAYFLYRVYVFITIADKHFICVALLFL